VLLTGEGDISMRMKIVAALVAASLAAACTTTDP
jgi:hypothetical protein